MTNINESIVEDAALAWLEGLGWQVGPLARTSRPIRPTPSARTMVKSS